jgi:hypothetical protein
LPFDFTAEFDAPGKATIVTAFITEGTSATGPCRYLDYELRGDPKRYRFGARRVGEDPATNRKLLTDPIVKTVLRERAR